jgi:hypothetical protein
VYFLHCCDFRSSKLVLQRRKPAPEQSSRNLSPRQLRCDASRHLPGRHRAGIGQFFHLRHLAVDRLELGEVVEDAARDIVDKGLGGGAIGEDDLVLLGLDMIDGNGVSKLQINQPELGFPPSSVERRSSDQSLSSSVGAAIEQ